MNPILCTWSAKSPKGAFGVWPDGCRDLVVVLDERQPPKVLCSGLDTSVRRVVCSDVTRFVGVRLCPGVQFPWDRADPSLMRRDLDLGPRWQPVARHWSPDVDESLVLRDLVDFVLSEARCPPSWVRSYVRDLSAAAAGPASLSERSLRRQLLQTAGAPPGFWRGLARARRAGAAICRSDDAFSAIAADQGFSDQAHMTREMRRWFDCTPGMLRADRLHSLTRFEAPDGFQVG